MSKSNLQKNHILIKPNSNDTTPNQLLYAIGSQTRRILCLQNQFEEILNNFFNDNQLLIFFKLSQILNP